MISVLETNSHPYILYFKINFKIVTNRLKKVKNGEKEGFFLEIVLTIGDVDGANCYSSTYGYLVKVIDSGGRKCFYIRSGLNLREAFSIVAGREPIFNHT